MSYQPSKRETKRWGQYMGAVWESSLLYKTVKFHMKWFKSDSCYTFAFCVKLLIQTLVLLQLPLGWTSLYPTPANHPKHCSLHQLSHPQILLCHPPPILPPLAAHIKLNLDTGAERGLKKLPQTCRRWLAFPFSSPWPWFVISGCWPFLLCGYLDIPPPSLKSSPACAHPQWTPHPPSNFFC